MKIIFHEKFYNRYTGDPAASNGRLEPIIDKLKENSRIYEFIKPNPATKEDILRAHTTNHYENIKRSKKIFDYAKLAAGGAIRAGNLACDGDPAFAVIRPPGHHASANSCWGFCFFNNISVSLLNLVSKGKISSAFILDFDLHTGDGNINILEKKKDFIHTKILNPRSSQEKYYLNEIDQTFKNSAKFDIIVASAGFDEYIKDWGGKLSTKAYNEIGKMMKDFAVDKCNGRRYALLEGGYYHEDLGINVDSFCKGLM
ncbi:MAG: histone deacetylase family protein [Candidatus Lokiarchaeota archaeon]|nr:histone deacetylase family protein [Candidatus Lokiarchaeota archaeon]